MENIIQSTVELITIIILLILLIIFVIKTYYRFERWMMSVYTKQPISKQLNYNNKCSYLWITVLLIIILLSLVIFTR